MEAEQENLNEPARSGRALAIPVPRREYGAMRCFVAIKVGDAVRDLLVRVQETLRRADAQIRWVERENLHLTLKFLGDLDDDQVASLKRLLSEEAPRWKPLQLQYGGIGTFPGRGVPRVVWAGATGDVERLAGLASAVERHAESVGVPRERHPFIAHLTIGRVKGQRNFKQLQSAILPQRQVPLGSDVVSSFELLQSTLTSDGPIYEVIESFALT
jgi:2'-5' RNA ligase